MSFDPPSSSERFDADPLAARIELMWEKPKGYATKYSETQDAIIGLSGVCAWLGLMVGFVFAIGSVGVPTEPAVIMGMLIFLGGGFLAVIKYERWTASLPSPKLVVPSQMHAGDDVRVEVHFDEDAIRGCEIVATRTSSSRNHEGRIVRRSDRFWSHELERIESPNDGGATRFDGTLSDSVMIIGTKWFVAVHLYHEVYRRKVRYVRPFLIHVEKAR